MTESLNRAFMYGESVFTTFRLVNGEPKDWEQHFTRLKHGAEFLYGPFTDGDQWVALFKNRVESKFQSEKGDKVIRLTVYREQVRGLMRTGLISITDLRIHLISTPFEADRDYGKMLKLRTCAAPVKPYWWPSFLKAGNYLETIVAQKYYLKPGDDDLLFVSSQDVILESSVANIFVVRHNKLYTAPVGPNVLEGVMRRKVIDAAYDFFEDFSETGTTIEQAYKANAIFGSNSVRGVFLINKIDDVEIKYDQDFLNKFETLRLKVTE